MTGNTQRRIKITVMWIEMSSCTNYQKMEYELDINTILKGRKQLIQESLHTFVTTYLLGLLINSSPVFNKINSSLVR